MTMPNYTTLNRIEIQTLLELKAPRCCFPVISAINSFMFDSYTSFPSIKTIIKWCGGHISKTSVERALRWLEKNNIITRGKAKTRTRFTNNIRKSIYGVKKKVDNYRSKPIQNSKIMKENQCQESSGVKMTKRCSNNRSNTTLQQMKHKENILEQNSLTPKPPKNQGVSNKPRKKSTIESRLVRAKRRVQNYTNILNNRELPSADTWKDEARSIWSYWLAMGQMQQGSQIKASPEDCELIRKLRAEDMEVNKIISGADVFRRLLDE